MKKSNILSISILSICSLLLFGCANNNQPSNPSEENPPVDPGDPQDPPQEEIKPAEGLLLTEINTGTTFSNRAVEISNISSEDISLKDYSIEVYRRYSDVSTESIPLDDYVIAKQSSFVIAYSGARQEILDKADLVTDQYINDGEFPVALALKGKPFDSIGVIGYNYDFAKSGALVRLKEYFKQTLDFDLSEWVRYPVNSIETLGNYDVICEQELLDGPRLSDEDFSKPFCKDVISGLGGLIEVSYVRNIDGDTTTFNYGNSYSQYDIYGNSNTRYYAINTPEIAHSAGEVSDPYGDEAKSFTTSMLNKAKHFYVQSVNGYSFRETYGRMLCYIWISFEENPKTEDYILLNWLIVKNGFSNPAFLTRTDEFHSLMTYKGISFIEYIFYAQQYAIKNKLNIHS